MIPLLPYVSTTLRKESTSWLKINIEKSTGERKSRKTQMGALSVVIIMLKIHLYSIQANTGENTPT